jgi:hypothetical protein
MHNPLLPLAGICTAAAVAAATLVVGGGVLQAGGEHDLVCDEDGVTVDLKKDESTGLLVGAKVTGIDEDCFGASLKFDTSALDEGGPFFVGSIGASQYSFPFSIPQEESDVADFNVAIFGSDSEAPNQND